MIYNCLVLTHTVTATDITPVSEIISLSSQIKLCEIKRNTYLTNDKLGKLLVSHLRSYCFEMFKEMSCVRQVLHRHSYQCSQTSLSATLAR